MNRRPLAAAAAGLATTLALAACGTSGGGDLERSDEPVTIRATWWGSDTRAELTEEAIAAFEAEYPDITVEGEFKDWSGYWDALATTTAANDSPDVIQMDELYLASYADRGVLLDLGEAGEFLDTADFEEASLETGQVGGALYGLPIGITSMATVVNVDLFEQYGVPLPDDATWTWDDYAATAQALTDASGGAINGSGVTGGMDTGSVKYWARLQGSEMFDEDGNVTLDPAALASLWRYNLDLIGSGAIESTAQTVESMAAGIGAGSLATGKIAMGFSWNTQITALRDASGADLRLLRLPGSGGSEATFYKPSMYWSVSSQSEHPAEAALFVDFLSNYEAAADILGTERGIPANTAILDYVSANLTESDRIAADFLATVAPGPSPVVTPNGASGVEPMLQRYTQDVLFGETEPDAAAQAFVEELQAEIDAA